MNHAQSARAFEIRIARTVMLFNGIEYRKAKSELNAYTTPVCKSVAWWMFNVTRDRYLKSMHALRSALKTPKGDIDPDLLVGCANSACRHQIPNGVEQCHICGAIQL